MANYLYNDIELPEIPASTSSVAVISAVLESASSMFGGASYIVTFGSSILWSGGKCYVNGINGVYRYNGSAWVWHYGSGTTYTQDIIASGYFEAVWTNTNIPTADGVSVYLAKTDPVPVGGESGGESGGEEETPETPEYTIDDVIKARREGFITGLLTGLSIKGVLHKRSIVEPVEADFYLYGTPSESGNVALADGEGYVLYNGAVLPPLPEWDKVNYPYAYIYKTTSGVYRVRCFTKALEYGTYTMSDGSGTNLQLHLKVNAGEVESYCTFEQSGNNWGDATSSNLDNSGGSTYRAWAMSGTFIWCNTDIPNVDTGAVYLASSDPIPLVSDEPVAAVYGGARLPVLPEYDQTAYPYALIYQQIQNGANYLALLSKPVKYELLNGQGVFRPTATANVIWSYSAFAYESEWMLMPESQLTTEQTFGSHGTKGSFALWSNHDLYDADDNVYVEGSEPVPIYEQKE